MVNQKTHPVKIEAAERRAYVLNLRKSGATYRDIARATVAQFGWDRLPLGYDERYVYKDVSRALDLIIEGMSLDVEAVRTMELERLDALLAGIYPLAIRRIVGEGDNRQVLEPDPDAIERVLRILDRRLKLIPNLQARAGVDLSTLGQAFNTHLYLPDNQRDLTEEDDAQ